MTGMVAGTRVDWRQLRRFVVRVDGAVGGTGFFVAPGWVLTAAHVVGDADCVAVFPDASVADGPVLAAVASRSASGQGTALWPFPDLALLHLAEDLDHPCVLLDGGDPIGECHALGFPPREHGVLAPGSPASFRFEGVEGDGYLKLQAGQAAPGLSGAPLVCPTRRAVVGVITASRDTSSDLGGWASPISALLTGGAGVPADLVGYGEQIRRSNRAAVLADRTAWHRVLPVEGAQAALDQPWATFTRKARSSPADMLRADFAVVPYLFRDGDLDAAVSWCEQATAMELARVAGRGGAGKTRFAIELCKAMTGRGWVTGLWSADRATQVTAVALPRLVVVDYAEAVAANTLRTVLDALRRHATDLAPVRVLLLTRTAAGGIGDPLHEVGKHASAALRTVLDDTDDTDAARALAVEQRQALHTTAVAEFIRAWYSGSGETPTRPGPGVADLTGARYELALEVLFEAFDQALGGQVGASTSRAPVDRVLDHEQRYWDATAPTGFAPHLRRPVVALATLAGAADPDQADALLAVMPDLAGDPAAASRRRIAHWLAGLYDGPDLLNPLRPDRLGEALIADVLASAGDDGRDLLTAVVDLPSDDQVVRCLDLLARLTAVDNAMAQTAARVLANRHDELVTRAETRARGGGPAHPGRLDLAAALLRLLTGHVGSILAAEPGNTTYQRDVSISYNKLADLAREAGQGEQAQALYRQALTIAEALAAAEPGNTTYQRDVSISYERLGALAAESRDITEAQRCFTYAAAVRRGLHRQEPKRVDLAEEFAVALRLLAGTVDGPDAVAVRHEMVDVLAPYERSGTITPKGTSLLGWARQQPSG